MVGFANHILAEGGWVNSVTNCELIKGNAIWRFVVVLLIVLITMIVARIARFIIESHVARREAKARPNVLTMTVNCVAKPISVAIFAVGLFICKLFLVFGEEGISPAIGTLWMKVSQAVAAVAVAYALYRLVDVVEYYLTKVVNKTETKLDDMLVPVVRKSLRVTIAIIATLYIADGILGAEIKTILFSAGISGIAVALAAKDTIANFFGSITIFADRPFQVDEMIRVGEHCGPVEEVGFRSTKIRTLQGHLVTIPNNTIANSMVENIGKRPFIRRTSNITITYDSSFKKTTRAVEIIKEVLAGVEEVNGDSNRLPRVYFSDFNDCSLNIYMSYWVKPANYWVYHEVNERVNFEILKRFDAEKIEFAFPTQTLYVKKD